MRVLIQGRTALLLAVIAGLTAVALPASAGVTAHAVAPVGEVTTRGLDHVGAGAVATQRRPVRAQPRGTTGVVLGPAVAYVRMPDGTVRRYR